MQRFRLRSSSAARLRTNTPAKDINADIMHQAISSHGASVKRSQSARKPSSLPEDDGVRAPMTPQGLPPRDGGCKYDNQRDTVKEGRCGSSQQRYGTCRSSTPTMMNSSLQCGVYRPSIFHLERQHKCGGGDLESTIVRGIDRSPEPHSVNSSLARTRPLSSLASQFSNYDQIISDGSYLKGCGTISNRDILRYRSYIKRSTPSAKAAHDDWEAMVEGQKAEKENKIKLRDQLHANFTKQLQQALHRREEEKRKGKEQRILFEDASYQEKLKNHQRKVMMRDEIKAQMYRDEQLAMAKRKEDQQIKATERRETTDFLNKEKERLIREREEKKREEMDFLRSGWEVQRRERNYRLEKALLEKKNDKINIDNFAREVTIETKAKKAAEHKSEMLLLQQSKAHQEMNVIREKELQQEFEECERQRVANAIKDAEEERKRIITDRMKCCAEQKEQVEAAMAKRAIEKRAEMDAMRRAVDIDRTTYERDQINEKRMIAIRKREFAAELEKQMRYNLQRDLQNLAAE
eukprot:Tbor_TRINITY_DN6749_c0_g1::TRINITY_DN6749_c0_g1_i1::g.15354::m.15354